MAQALPAAGDSGMSAATAAGEPIRILHVITRLIVGGAMENTLLTVIGQMRNPRYEVTLWSGIDEGPEGNLHEYARAQGVNLVLSRHLGRAIRPASDLMALIELTRFIRAGRFHIVHTHTSKAGILGRIAARLGGAPIVVHTLHSLVFNQYQSGLANRLYILAKRICAPLTDQFISVSQATASGALAAGIGDPARHTTVLSGMDLAPFLNAEQRTDRSAFRRRFGLPVEALVVGKVARLFPLKGHAHFLTAAAAIHQRRPEVHFLLVGNGVLRQALEAEVERLGLRSVVHFAGLVRPEEIPQALVAMDVVVHTSLREGIARVLPQALAVGRPVVTFALDGAPEVIENGRSGYIVPPLDTAALAERVIELLDDPERRRAMAAFGRDFVVREFPTERMVERINALYDEHLRRRGIGVGGESLQAMPGGSRALRDLDETPLSPRVLGRPLRIPAPLCNILSFDVEDWYQGIEMPSATWDGYSPRLERGLNRILELLAERSVSATFFTLGYVADRHPELVRRIAEAGHEVGTHGYAHEKIYDLDPARFRADLRRSLDSLQSATGRRVLGHRGPFFSITRRSLWALDILAEEGLKYDASIYPGSNYRYGIPAYPEEIRLLDGGLIECPVSTFGVFGWRAGIGGAYLRLLPGWATAAGVRALNRRDQPAGLYLHPWEFDPEHPRVRFRRLAMLTHYARLRTTEPKLRRLLGEFSFGSYATVLGLESGAR